MRATNSQETEDMTDDPRTPEAQRTREARPAEDPRTNAGPQPPPSSHETGQKDRVDSSTHRDHGSETGSPGEAASDVRDRPVDSRERAHDTREGAEGARESARTRQADRTEHSANRNGSRMQPAERVQHTPGEVHSDRPVDLWPDRAADGLRERWRELQLLFVDDPKAAVTEADAVLAETIEVLNGSLQAARSDLSEWRNKREVDTEGLRVAVQRYRNVLDRVLAL